MVQNLSSIPLANSQPRRVGRRNLVAQVVKINEHLANIEKILSTPQRIEIDLNITILLIIFNFFIPWWLYRDRPNRLAYLLNSIRETPLYAEAVREISRNPELLRRFKVAFEAPDSESFERAEFQEISEEEQKWQERVSMIQDLYRDILQSDLLQSSSSKSPSREQQNPLEEVSQKLDNVIQELSSIPMQPEESEDIKAIRSQMTEVRAQLAQLLSREDTVEPRLEQDIAQLLSGEFPQPTQEALACVRQISLIEDLICEEPFNVQKTIESLEDMRQNLGRYLGLLAADRELQQDFQNAFNPAGWNDSLEVRSQHFLGLQLLRLRILQYFAGTGEAEGNLTQES